MTNLNINKISNEEDGFLITYYAENGAKIIVVNGENIVAELNKAFEDLKKIAEERKAKDEARMAAYDKAERISGLGAGAACIGSNSFNASSESITRAA